MAIKIAPMVIFAYIIAIININIKKQSFFYESVPSVTTFHAAKRFIPFLTFHLPLFYISVPFEVYLTGIPAVHIAYSYGLFLSILWYKSAYNIRLHKPPVL